MVADPVRRVGCAGGFSLVEVLLAVVVLGLGLLGIASVFPVVISQQREAAETVAAVGAAEAAESFLAGAASSFSVLLNEPGFGEFAAEASMPINSTADLVDSEGRVVRAIGGDVSLLWQPGFSWGASATVVEPAAASGQTMAFDAYLNEGLVVIGGSGEYISELTGASATVIAPGDAGHPGTLVIPVDARLHPSPFSGATPRFVWDIALRRSRGGRVEAAVFVRSIELGIEPVGGEAPLDVRLSDRLARPQFGVTSTAASEKRLAVGMDPVTLTPTGRGARFNAAAAAAAEAYAIPLAAEAEVPEGPAGTLRDFDLIVVRAPVAFSDEDAGYPAGFLPTGGADGPPAWLDLLAQPGQTFVDNLGVVRRVVGEVEGDEIPEWLRVGNMSFNPQSDRVLRVEPGYSLRAARMEFAGGVEATPMTLAGDGMTFSVQQRDEQLFQVVFTSQPPVMVFVTEVRP